MVGYALMASGVFLLRGMTGIVSSLPVFVGKCFSRLPDSLRE